MNPIQLLHKTGQSVWYDNIQRKILINGELKSLIDDEIISGVTSNPSIFNNAITKSVDYDDELKELSIGGMDASQINERLSIEDIQTVAKFLHPIYENTSAKDGYVSLEVNPHFAYDTEKTILEARRLWQEVNKPNLMIKVPATEDGISALRQLIADGINVNATLIFSIARYIQVIDAYLSGLEERRASKKKLDTVSSVASFFVSRIDTKVDRALNQVVIRDDGHRTRINALLGKTAIANARIAYGTFQEALLSDRYQRLISKGAQIQRPLWASTSTKNPNYSDVMYVEELIGPLTVNTIPPDTLTAFMDHGRVNITVTGTLDSDRSILNEIEKLGVSLDEITKSLEQEGVQAFVDANDTLVETIGIKAKGLI